MEYMLMPIRRYADFQGRSRRKEYWMFVLFQLLVMIGIAVLFAVFDSISAGMGSIMLGLGVLAYLGLFFLPSIAVQVRRFHDQDKSGWFVLLSLVPYVGGLIMLFFMVQPGTAGPNRFGPDPLDESQASVFE